MAIWRRIRPVVIDPLYHHQMRCLSYLAGDPVVNRACGRRRSGAVEKPLCLSPALEFSFISVRSFAAPVQAKLKSKLSVNSSAGPRLNDAITAPFVRVVTDEGHCVISRLEALDRARRLNLDLVEVQRRSDPPVCRIMDFYKEKFKQELKEKERAKSKSAVALRNGENKEIRFTPKTELKDLKMKADTITRLMERGYRVKCTAMPAGKENDDLAGLLSKVLALIEDISIVESGPHAEASKAYAIVRHVKFATKKSGKKVSKVLEAVSKGLPFTERTGEDDISSQDEEEWEPIDDSSTTEVEDCNNQIEAKAQSLSSAPQATKSPPIRDFSKGLGQSGLNENDFIRMTDPSSVRNHNLAGFSQNTNTPRPADRSTEPSVVETNRYARETDPNGRFNQAKPIPRRASMENPVVNQGRWQPPRNTSEGQVQFDPRQRQQPPRNASEGQVQFDPRQRQQPPRNMSEGQVQFDPRQRQQPPRNMSEGQVQFDPRQRQQPPRNMSEGQVQFDQRQRQQPPRNMSEGQVQFDPRQRQPNLRNSQVQFDPRQRQPNLRNSQVQFDPRQRQSNPTEPVSPSPRYGVFISSKTASSSDAAVSEPNNSSKPSYGIFSGQKIAANHHIQNQGKPSETNIASREKRDPADATADKPGNSSAGRTSFGIFSDPNRAGSSDQKNTNDANNPNPSPLTYGIFSSSSDQRN